MQRRGWVAWAVTTGVWASACAQTTAPQNAGDDALYAELARRGLTALLEKAFEENHVPQARRAAIQALAPGGGSPVAFLQATTQSMEQTIASERDPKVLLDQGQGLIQSGVAPALNIVEYWGESTPAMARLRPLAEGAARLLTRSTELAKAQADTLGNKLDVNNAAAMAQLAKANDLATLAEFSRRMNDYAVVLSLDAADASRGKMADETIDYLRQYDNPDSTVQPIVHLYIGKLQLAKGSYSEALRTLDDFKPAGTIKEPSAAQRFEARYFAAVADMKAGRPDDAGKRLEELSQWSKATLPKESQGSADATTLLLRYRIDASAKRDDAARDDLLALLKAHPEMENRILDQFAARVSDSADVHTMDVLSLKAVLRRAETEQARPLEQSADLRVLTRGVAAGQELIARRGAAAISDAMLRDAALRIPTLLERSGRKLEAASAFLDYLDLFGPAAPVAKEALDEALALIVGLRQANPEDLAAGQIFDRALALAVAPPFNRNDLAFARARRLQQSGKYVEAAAAYAQVPDSDPDALRARYYRTVALKQLLDDHVGGATAGEVVQLAKQVSAEARRDMERGKESEQNRVILARTTIVLADVLLKANNDPRGALAALDGYDALVGPLSNGRTLQADANNLRVQALMASGQDQQATETLVGLLQASGGAEGANTVLKLLTRLNTEFDEARSSGNVDVQRTLARSRAALSGFLVTWAEKNADPKIREFTGRYRRFDADTQRQSAELEPDDGARVKGLGDALARYKALQDPAAPDPLVDFDIAVTQYALGDFAAAQAGLASLLEQRRLGRPTEEQEKNGEVVVVPNERYWEALLKSMRASLKLVEAGKAPPSARQGVVDGLESNYARWGRGMGGPKWAEAFEKLRQDVDPGYQVPNVSGK